MYVLVDGMLAPSQSSFALSDSHASTDCLMLV